MKLVLVLLMASVLISCTAGLQPPPPQPVDCSEIYSGDSGVYTIYPTIRLSSAVQVYCDMESAGGSGTVIQRRMDGSVNFYRSWNQYKMGFGNAAGEYWLGLESIHQLTRARNYELEVEMEDFEGNKAFAHYTTFRVEAERDGYTLRVFGFIDGGAGDSLSYHDGMKFSTFDKDQDLWSSENCAVEYTGAFWYNDCHYANPNGAYQWGPTDTLSGLVWYDWKSSHYSMKSISMKIRPVQN